MSVPLPESPFPPSVGAADASAITQDDRTMAMLAHLLGIFTGFLGPLVIWLIKKDQSKFVAYHGMQALIFQIALNLVMLGLGITVILIFLAPVVWVIGIVFAVLAGLAANKGDWYEIPIVGKFARQQVGL